MQTVITLYNQSVQIESNDQQLLDLIGNFLETLYTERSEGFGFNAPPIVRMYAGTVTGFSVYFLLNAQFKHLLYWINQRGYKIGSPEIKDQRDYEVKDEEYKVRPGWKLREDQIPVYDFLMENPIGNKLVPLATGSGKTFISLYTMAKQKKRFALMILPTFMEKWVSDVLEIHEATKDDIVILQGNKAIKKLVEYARQGQMPWKYHLFSIPTMRSFIDVFETDPQQCEIQYGTTPLELFPLLGINTLLVDETHMAFHALFRIVIYSNVKLQVGLSATLLANNDLEKRVYDILYPVNVTYGDSMVKRIIDFFPTTYGVDQKFLNKLRWSNGRGKNGAYNHGAFEKSILKYSDIKKAYLEMVDWQVKVHYIDHYLPKDKCIIFVYLVKMADSLVEYLTEEYPDLKVVRYCEDDTYDEMMTGDIIVSTVGSAGTGLDIPNLRVGIQTVSLSSPKSNIQSAGRLRELKDRDVKFVWLFCDKIDKQKNHNRLRLELFRDRAKSITKQRSQIGLYP